MKRVSFSLLILSGFIFPLNAQTPQFAVVRPDGTTYLCPSFDSAYNKSINGDNIYLPGGTFTCSTSIINKRLNIIGAGHHPDSSVASGRTQLTTTNNQLFIDAEAAGGSLEGINLISNNVFFKYSNKRINGFTIKRCFLGNLYFHDGNPEPPIDSLPTGITIAESIFYTITCYNAKDNFFLKNLIFASITSANFATIRNNIFTNNYVLTGSPSNCIIENNIFLSANLYFNQEGCNNNYYNNLKVGPAPILFPCSPTIGIESGTIFVPSVDNIFISYNPLQSTNPYINDFHLNPACPGINAGTDGTDIGIYGTANPTSEGWVPSNPHFYFKQVAPQTNANGQLPVQYKVRTNN